MGVSSNTNASLTRVDGNVIGAHITPAHEALFLELPMRVAVGAIPLAGGGVLPLEGYAHGTTFAVPG